MKTWQIMLNIDLSITALIVLTIGVIGDHWYLAPPAIGVVALLHLVFVGVFAIGGEKKLMFVFLMGFGVLAALGIGLFAILKVWFPLVFDAYHFQI